MDIDIVLSLYIYTSEDLKWDAPKGQRGVILHLLTFQSPIYRLQSNSYLITFKDADRKGRRLKC